jgi:hypothetical protein
MIALMNVLRHPLQHADRESALLFASLSLLAGRQGG